MVEAIATAGGHDLTFRCGEGPVSEARDTSRHPLARASKRKGHQQTCDSQAAFDLKFLKELAA